MRIYAQLGIKKTFGFWSLNLIVNGQAYCIPIPKRIWDQLRAQKLPEEG